MCCVDWRISVPCAASSKITVLSVKSQSHSTAFFCFSARINLWQRVRMIGWVNAWTESIKRLRYNRMFLLNKAFVWLCVWTVLHLYRALPFHCWSVGKYYFYSTTFCWDSAFFSIRQRGISLFKRARSLWMVPETVFLSDCRWHSASAWRLC